MKFCYNNPELYFQVRIFTYLIGREAAFADNLKWMACANKGRFHFCAKYAPLVGSFWNLNDLAKCLELLLLKNMSVKCNVT